MQARLTCCKRCKMFRLPQPKNIMAIKNKLIVNAYINFNGRCEEAIEFYKRALGAEVLMLARFKDCPDKGMISPGSENKVMHARLQIGETAVMASDGRCMGKTEFAGISLSLTVPTDADADRCFNALADGGQVQMPLTKTFFSSKFGMLGDKFGVSWMVIVNPN
jgi:PhnB protein